MKKQITGIFIIVVLVLSAMIITGGCTTQGQTPPTDTQVTIEQPASYPITAGEKRFKIATTTSLYDTGLWYYLEPIFEQKENVEMDIVYAGTGIALEYGRRGDVDAVIVHDPAQENKFIEEGYGINRRYFAYNFFLIAGPPDDPAGIRGLSATDALKKLYEEGQKNPDTVKFVSRGDNSGTHGKEKVIWKNAGISYEDVQKSGTWYVEAGKGMGPVLLMASEMNAYVLCDISTFLAYQGKLNLQSLVEKDPMFINVYAVMAINPEKVEAAKIDVANDFINWLISPEVQEIIGTYGVAEYGRSLFNPLSKGDCTIPGCPKVEDYTVPVP